MVFKADMRLFPPQDFSDCGYDFNKQLIMVTENKLVQRLTVTFFFKLSYIASPCDTQNFDLWHKNIQNILLFTAQTNIKG